MCRATSLSLAIGAAFASAPCFALDPSDSMVAIAAGRVVYISGASAPTRIVYTAFHSFCEPGTGDAYGSESMLDNVNVTPGDVSWKNFLAYSCTFKSTTPLWATQDVVLFHTIDGGSFKSVEGMSDDTNLQVMFINEAFAGCTDNGTSVTALGDNVYDRCARNLNTGNAGRSNGGFSDVEKQIFQDVVAAVPGLAAIANAVTVYPTYAMQTFGVAATPDLYAALQASQGLINTVANDGEPCDQVNSPACQPSITHRQYASIAVSNPFSAAHADWRFLVPGLAQPVYLCRRVDTSGTQAASNVYFLRNPCGRGPATFGERVAASQANDEVPGAFEIDELASTGNVKSCLSVAGRYAVGVISGENLRTGGTDDDWFWLKLGGTAINEDAFHRASAVQGRYDFAYEIVLHLHDSLSQTGPGGDNPNRPFLLQALAGQMSSPGFAANVRGLFLGATGGCSPGLDPACSYGERGGSSPNACAPFTN